MHVLSEPELGALTCPLARQCFLEPRRHEMCPLKAERQRDRSYGDDERVIEHDRELVAYTFGQFRSVLKIHREVVPRACYILASE